MRGRERESKAKKDIIYTHKHILNIRAYEREEGLRDFCNVFQVLTTASVMKYLLCGKVIEFSL